jgi:hypothetical protein
LQQLLRIKKRETAATFDLLFTLSLHNLLKYAGFSKEDEIKDRLIMLILSVIL